MNKINVTQHPCANKCSEFKKGDCIVFDSVYRTSAVLKIAVIADDKGYVVLEIKNKRYIADLSEIRPATNVEIAAGHRIGNDMGDDAHIENHISQLCKTESQPVLIVESDNQIIERLQAENKMLHEAAATHLRNQNHLMDWYNRLVEQLYPYAIDLKEPVDGDVNTPKEYMDGYNRAREIAHCNLLEMMKSNKEYIRAQCGMLGGEA